MPIGSTIIAALMAGMSLLGSAQEGGGATAMDGELRMGFTLAYEDAIQRKDVRVATSYLITKALASNGVKVNFSYFDTYQEGLDAVLANEVSSSELPGHYYASLNADDREKLRGILLPQRHETQTSQYYLIGRAGVSLGDLKGLKLRMVSQRNRGLAAFWLKTLIAEDQGAAGLETFFSEVVECDKPADALVPTFFGKADACLISSGDYELLTELNPQIGKRLAVLHRSDKLVPMVLVLRSDYRGIDIDAGVRAATRLHLDGDGQQALTLMQVCRFSPFEEKLFEPTRALVERAQSLGVSIR